MRFSHIELINWKNFRHVEVDLPSRVFLVGPNASGKSNFLDALRFLRDLARPGGGLKNACEERGDISKIRCLSARTPRGITINVRVTDDESNLQWRYEIAFTQDTKYPSPGTPILIREVVEKDGVVLVDRPDENDETDPLLLTQTALEQVYFNQKFREISDFFSEISYLHLIPQIVRSGTLSSDPNMPDIFGGQFLERVASTTTKTRDARLKRILESLQIAVPQLEDLRLKRDQRGVPHLEVLYQHWRPNAGRQDETQLSDGTLRLLALLWLLDEGTGTLLMEEPELSLHAGIVRRLAGIIYRSNRKKRQTVISTHSADLLSDPGISGHEVLMFEPTDEGTHIYPAASVDRIKTLLETGLPVSEVVIPATEPPNLKQLELL